MRLAVPTRSRRTTRDQGAREGGRRQHAEVFVLLSRVVSRTALRGGDLISVNLDVFRWEQTSLFVPARLLHKVGSPPGIYDRTPAGTARLVSRMQERTWTRALYSSSSWRCCSSVAADSFTHVAPKTLATPDERAVAVCPDPQRKHGVLLAPSGISAPVDCRLLSSCAGESRPLKTNRVPHG
jgi:hypothetical protein